VNRDVPADILAPEEMPRITFPSDAATPSLNATN
jgi:hypothetical protein